ncbi:glycosyltransferase [Micromonospora sp. NPDC051296]|uniref:glycosyltransferase n=1 Tax=Micromonospora sp. NPDC051296 TaxID=3155046 RepID=UPI00342C3BC2
MTTHPAPTRKDSLATAGGWIAYVGPFRFPWGEPGSRRVLGLARSMAAAGHDVVVAGGDDGPASPAPVDGVAGTGRVRYVGLGERPTAGTGRLATVAHLLVRLGEQTVRWLDSQPTRPACVVVYGGGTQYIARIGRWCRRHGVPLVADVVEWYAPHQLAGGALGPVHLSAKLALHYYYPRCQGVIAISSLLERHYRERGVPVLRVPPTLDVLGLRVRDHGLGAQRPGLHLVYFGTPGRKDLLGTVVRAVDSVGREAQLTLSVYGPSVDEVRGLLGGADLPPSVRVPGRVPQPQVEEIVSGANFSVLVRPSARFTNAGFPTKFAESLACGTPVIANLTSDLGQFLTDGEQGLVCRDATVTELRRVLCRAVRLSGAQLAAMRVAARATAETAFDYRRYAGRVDAFLNALPLRRQ